VTTLGAGEPADVTVETRDDGYYLNFAVPKGGIDGSLDRDKTEWIGRQRRSDNTNNGFFPSSLVKNATVTGSAYTAPDNGIVRVWWYADQGTNINAMNLWIWTGDVSNNTLVNGLGTMIQNKWQMTLVPVNKGEEITCRIWTDATQTFKFYEAWATFQPYKKTM